MVVLGDDAIVNVEIKWNERVLLRILAQPLPPIYTGATHGTRGIAQSSILAR